MIDIYLKDKKNLKRITDFSTQLKIKTNALRARRDELQKEREEFVKVNLQNVLTKQPITKIVEEKI